MLFTNIKLLFFVNYFTYLIIEQLINSNNNSYLKEIGGKWRYLEHYL